MVFDLLWRDLHPSLVLLVDALGQSLHHHICDVVHVLPAFECGDTVHKADLLEALVRDTDRNLPSKRSKLLRKSVIFCSAFTCAVLSSQEICMQWEKNK